MEGFVLIRPTEALLPQIAAYRAEFAAAGALDWMHGSGGLMHMADAEAWLACIRSCADTSTQFVYLREADGKLVGMINVRHTHTEPLETFGGHIGYSVAPSERRKGYATAMLREVLPHCRTLGLTRVLLTCGDENLGSLKTILANGSVYEKHVLSPKHHIMVGRYWIAL